MEPPTVLSRGRRGTWRHHRRFAWQAWHLATSTIVSRGRRGTWRQPPSFRVAGVALGEIHHRFAWQASHLATSTVVSRGRRGTWRHPPSFHVAGVALLELGWLMVALSHPGRIKIDELPSAYTMAMHKIQTVGAGICSRCRFMSGCLACDPHKCTSYWMRRESARLGRPIDDEYKKS